MEAPFPTAAPRIAVLTSDDAVVAAAQETLASDFHTTLLDSPAGVLTLQREVTLEAAVLDFGISEEATEPVLALVRQLRDQDESLVLAAILNSSSKSLRRALLGAGIGRCFLTPVQFEEIQAFLREALEERRRELETRKIRDDALSRYSFGEIVGGSECMRLIYDAIGRVAKGNTTILIRGESGTGKELVARAIVTSSNRSEGPFVSVNCAALPEALIESELFGHEKGAFTGAHQARAGQIELADRGTLFLDEIGTLGLGLQSKLLRALEQRAVQRIGAKAPRKIDFRLITATNEDLEVAVHAGRFREDLYYRINVVPITLPPLRERPGDVALLVDHFMRLYCTANEIPPKNLDSEALAVLEEYSWPGNVRELENLVQRMVLMVSGPTIYVKHLPQQILYASSAKRESLLIPEEGISFDEEMQKIEIAYLSAALRRTNGSKAAAARLLGLDSQRMKYLCRKLNL